MAESKLMRCRGIGLGLLLAAGVAGAQQAPELMADPQRRPSVTLGSDVRSLTIRSAILDQSRQIRIVLPASYAVSASTRRYPVAIVLDGETTLAATAAVSDELARNGLIPESIIVAVENVGGLRGRVRDLTPPGLSVSGSSLQEGGDRFLDFIERELLPAVDRQFRGGEPRTLIGHSSGGILATYAAATRPSYRAVIAIDTPIDLGDNWLAGKLTAATHSGRPLRYVSYEARFGWPESAWHALVSAAPASWLLRREPLRLEGHETLYMLGAYLGLREVFYDYSRLVTQEKPAATVLQYYASLTKLLGGDMPPPRSLLRTLIDDLNAEGRGSAARAAYEVLAGAYGVPADSTQLLAEVSTAERRPEPTETVESLLATPFPNPEEARRFIGDWVGDQWMTREQPRTGQVTLRIRVEDGKVTGQLLNPTAPPELRVRKLDYLRVTPAGLTYGLLNGMRPRGVVMWEGTLEGDTLAGTQRWGGVSFPAPADSTLEPGFSFRRAAR